MHWKSGYPLAETVKGLQDLQAAGLIRHWGVSNFDTADMQELVAIAGEGAVFANEDLYNIDKRGVNMTCCLGKSSTALLYWLFAL